MLLELILVAGIVSVFLPTIKRVQELNEQPLDLPKIKNLDLTPVVRKRCAAHR